MKTTNATRACPSSRSTKRNGFAAHSEVYIRREIRAPRWDGEKMVPGELLMQSPRVKNLVLDQGLKGMARDTTGSIDTYPANAFLACRVGSGTNANRFQSGAITFTQSGTTVTASGGFFTAAMVGGILKYGTNTTGVEYYITAFGSSTSVTVNTSATVGATVGTVWMVQQTALQTLSFSTSTYQTNSGDCQTTIVANVATHKRTFVFAPQASPYTVNEIGWYKATAGTNVYGRVVLSSSDVVGTSNFYLVIMELLITYSPATPSAVSDIGVNFNTAGNAAIEALNNNLIRIVASNGTVSGTTGQGIFDGSATNSGSIGANMLLIGATWTQNATPQSTAPTLTAITNGDFTITSAFANAAGSGFPFSFDLSQLISRTTDGDTIHGLAYGNVSSKAGFSIKLTTPQASPNGTMQFTVNWRVTYSRTLDNA